MTSLAWNVPFPADRQTFPPEQVFEAGLNHHHIANTAFPIHHQTTVRPYRVPRSETEPTAVADWLQSDRLGLYVHVPFCAKRCRYCEYAVVDSTDSEAQNVYFGALLRELAAYRQRLGSPRKTLIGFDIGGGTPSFIEPSLINQVIEAARATFDFQAGIAISIETTPNIADRDPDKLTAFKGMGIDRISMGVQTTHLELARSLGREYGEEGVLDRAVDNIRGAGFERLNLDLMYGFAGQSLEMWQTTVRRTIALRPEYITLYRVRYKGTRIQAQAASVSRRMVNELGTGARDLLTAAGYASTPGKNTYSRVPDDVGTSDYLTERVVKGTPYLGVGLGAQSMSLHTLSYNLGAKTKTLRPYLDALQRGRLPIQDLYHLPLEVAVAKMIAVSFYFGEIHRQHFAQRFGRRLEDLFPREVAFVLQRGLMEKVGPYLRLTHEGAWHFNGVIALFYSGAVKEYLIGLDSAEQHAGRNASERKTA